MKLTLYNIKLEYMLHMITTICRLIQQSAHHTTVATAILIIAATMMFHIIAFSANGKWSINNQDNTIFADKLHIGKHQQHSISGAYELANHHNNQTVRHAYNDAINNNDKVLYRRIWGLQNKALWHDANALIAKLNNKLLLGHILAQRYLHSEYQSNPEELANWLLLYADHPQANKIYKLAVKKGANPLHLKKPAGNNMLTNFGTSHVNQRFRNASWNSALRAYAKGNYLYAYKKLTTLLHSRQAKFWKAWDKAALHFWIYRTAKKLDMMNVAAYHLNSAATYQRTFYGIQANHALGNAIKLNLQPTELTKQERKYYLHHPAIIRVKALISVGKFKNAEQEIRYLFPTLSLAQKYKLLAFIMPMNLPAAQISMAVDLQHKTANILDYALYPIPNWAPSNGYELSPALIYAVARQESGFNPLARSYAGATGIMQIMPATARYMMQKMHKELRLDIQKTGLNDPANNITLGQHYLNYLMNKPYIENNLVFLAIAYNAGPGNLLKWKEKYKDDPLLFIEKIPVLETRNYVQNILTNYWIYSQIMGNHDQSSHALLAGKWPSYNSDSSQLASNISNLIVIQKHRHNNHTL